jgi:lipoyl(octanoyl) transferase
VQLIVKGRAAYGLTVEAMQAFTTERGATSPDALWICEHPAVFTQGLAGKSDHLLNPGDIPVVQTTRGGQVTFHGPGQVVAYPLIDLKRAGYYVKEYVYRIEEAVIRTLAHYGVTGHRVAGAPGIYVRLQDPFSHLALTGPAVPGEPFRGLGKIAALASRSAATAPITAWR